MAASRCPLTPAHTDPAASPTIVTTTRTRAGGSSTGLLVPNAVDRTWTWTSADDLGNTLTLKGKPTRAGMTFEGRETSILGPASHVRVTLKPESGGTVAGTVEVSEDGTAWRVLRRETYTRMPQQEPEPK